MNHEILSNIESRVLNELNSRVTYDYSLFGGSLGQVIYLFLRSKDDVRIYSAACTYLDKVLLSLKKHPLEPSYCNGVAGLCIGLLILEEEGMVENIDNSLCVYDDYLIYSLNELIQFDLDFLHGAIGIGIYLLKRALLDEKVYNNVVGVLDYLEKNALSCKDGGIYWLYPNRYRSLEQNFSMSHGICSTVMFLSRAYRVMKTDEDKEKCLRLLKGIGRYLVSNLVEPTTIGCFTPMVNTGGKSRLGWCYGDMGTSIGLRAIGDLTEDKSILDISYRIAVYTAKYRNDLEKDFIKDACLCHGSSGVAHFFYNCYSYYNDVLFLKAYEKWTNITMRMYDNIDGYNMFGVYRYDTCRKHKCLDILEGDVGVGLMLMRKHALLDNLLLYYY